MNDKINYVFVPVAQLDRVLASEAEGCEFEPHRAHHTKRRVF